MYISNRYQLCIWCISWWSVVKNSKKSFTVSPSSAWRSKWCTSYNYQDSWLYWKARYVNKMSYISEMWLRVQTSINGARNCPHCIHIMGIPYLQIEIPTSYNYNIFIFAKHCLLVIWGPSIFTWGWINTIIDAVNTYCIECTCGLLLKYNPYHECGMLRKIDSVCIPEFIHWHHTGNCTHTILLP